MEPRPHVDDDCIDFDVKELTAVQKLEFGRTISSGVISAAKLGRRHSINDRTLIKYALQHEKGLVIYEKGGRPPALDEDSVAACVEIVRRDTNISDKEIRDLIDMEILKTYCRRHKIEDEACVDDNDMIKPSRWFYFRYTKKIRGLI